MLTLNTLPYYLKFLTSFVVFTGGWFVTRWPVLFLVIICFLCVGMALLCWLVLCGLCLPSLLMVFLFTLYGVGYRATKVYAAGLMEYFGGQGLLLNSL